MKHRQQPRRRAFRELVGRPYEPDGPKSEERKPLEPDTSSKPPQSVEARAQLKREAKESRAMEKFRGEDANSAPKGADPLLYQAPRPPAKVLKSPAHPVIPSPNPAAPYGFDENDRPIGMPVGKPYLPPVQTGTIERPSGPCRCGKLLCRHCHPEFIAQTDVLKVTPPTELDKLKKAALQAKFGQPTATVPVSEFIFLPGVLGITRRQLIEMMSMTVAYEPRAVRKRVLKNRAVIENKIRELEMLNAKAVELKAKIHESVETIHGLLKRVMKLRRDHDNVLDKNTREKFKREERKKISDATQELQAVRNSIRDAPKLDELKDRLTNWGKSDDDFELVATTTTGPVSFGEKFELSPQFQEDHPRQSIDTYAAFLNSFPLVMDYSHRLRGWAFIDEWRYLENEIVRQAIGWKLLKPTKATIKKYPDLAGSWTEEDYKEDDSENALILKSGGASIGASIYNFGRNASGSRRLSGSFDNAVQHANKDGRSGGGSSESWESYFSDMDSGDFSYEDS